MDPSPFVAKAVAILLAHGLSCTNPDIAMKSDILIGADSCRAPSAQCIRAAGVFMRVGPSLRNTIWINEHTFSWYDDRQRLHVVLHELVHCARIEYNAKYGRGQPANLDPGEERTVEYMTKSFLGEDE